MTAVATLREQWNPETVTARCVNTGPAGYPAGGWLVKAGSGRLGTSSRFKDCLSAAEFQAASRVGVVNFRLTSVAAARSLTESDVAKRKEISKKTRFEVFKRDSFTCQYCGAAAPQAVLHVDHIKPVAGGGGNDLLNLLTACQDCNGGKGARRLDDSSEVQKQHAQLAELQARREQVEMMLEWRETLQADRETDVDLIAKEITKHGGWEVNENGQQDIKRWLKRYPLDLLLDAVTESFETYLFYLDGEPTESTWHKAFNKVPGVASVLKQKQAKPYLKDLFYIQGIVRKRLHNKWISCVEDLEAAHLAGATIESLTDYAKRSRELDAFYEGLDRFVEENGGRS